jgi:DNA replication protein DnaC
MNTPSLPIGINPLSSARLPENLCGITMDQLAAVARDPQSEAMKMVEAECSQGCGAKFTCVQVFAALTACEECRRKADEADALERAKKHWENLCPSGLRDTRTAHEDFPRAQYQQLKPWAGESSLFFYGDTRSGKTRLALLMLKRALLRRKYVGVLWPEDFESMKNSRDAASELKRYGTYDVLLLDDILLTGARDERLSGWLKNLLDYMIRHGRKWIVTSQIGGDDYKEQARKFGDIDKSDEKRIEALLGRLRENSQVVPFVKAMTAAVGEEAF